MVTAGGMKPPMSNWMSGSVLAVAAIASRCGTMALSCNNASVPRVPVIAPAVRGRLRLDTGLPRIGAVGTACAADRGWPIGQRAGMFSSGTYTSGKEEFGRGEAMKLVAENRAGPVAGKCPKST